MDQNTMIILIVLGACALIAGFVLLRRYLTGKKIDGDAVADKVIDYANVAEAFAAALAPFLPPYLANILKPLASATYAVVQTIEELWEVSGVPEDKRKSTAIEMIRLRLQKSGITIDDNIDKWIGVAVDLMVRFLPKSHPEEITVTSSEVPADTAPQAELTSDGGKGIESRAVAPSTTGAA